MLITKATRRVADGPPDFGAVIAGQSHAVTLPQRQGQTRVFGLKDGKIPGAAGILRTAAPDLAAVCDCRVPYIRARMLAGSYMLSCVTTASRNSPWTQT